MTPVYISDRGLIPVYDGDEEVYNCLAGIDVTPTKISTPRHLVRWYNYEALQISKGLGSLARLELHLRLSQHRSVNDFSKSK